METELSIQLIALLLALAMGAGIGVLYDILRPVRRRTGCVGGAALDILFCILCGGAVFVYAMGATNGKLGLWELTSALLGFLLYMHTLSDYLLGLFTKILDALCRLMDACKKIMKKSAHLAKILFQKVRECFIIKK